MKKENLDNGIKPDVNESFSLAGLFRKVLTEKRLPEKYLAEYYVTDLGELLWSHDAKCFKSLSFPYPITKKPKWWLEEIELPTEPVIDSMADDYGDKYGVSTESYDSSKAICHAFEDGAKWMRSELIKRGLANQTREGKQ